MTGFELEVLEHLESIGLGIIVGIAFLGLIAGITLSKR